MQKKVLMMDIFKNPRYRGKHVILAGGKIYTAKTGDGAADILRKLRQKNPDIIPEVAYLPKAHSLIFSLMGRLGFLETFDNPIFKIPYYNIQRLTPKN